MEKAIVIGFELLLIVGLFVLTVIAFSFPWPGSLLSLISIGGMTLLGLVIIDIARR